MNGVSAHATLAIGACAVQNLEARLCISIIIQTYGTKNVKNTLITLQYPSTKVNITRF